MREEFITDNYDVTRKHSVVQILVLAEKKNEQC